MSVAPPSGQDRIMIYGPKDDGTYVLSFGPPAANRSRSRYPAAAVLKHFQARMPNGLVGPM
jgi:hypothetical protein